MGSSGFPEKLCMVTANDLDQLDRIGQNIGLRIAEVDRIISANIDEAPASLPSHKAFEGLSMKLLLWQNRLQEISRQVKQAESDLLVEDDGLRSMVQRCGELKRKSESIPVMAELLAMA